MKALILAAGFGTRLRPFTNTAPKALVPVNGIPLILYILAFLKKNGITDIVINLHHHGTSIPKLLGNGKKLGLQIQYSHEPSILGTGGGIKKALRYLDDPFLIVNGDVIADFDIKKFISQHKKQFPYATLALHDHKDSKKYGLLYYIKNQLVSILNHPHAPQNSRGAMFASFHILSKKHSLKDFKEINKSKFCIMHDIYIPQIKNNKTFGAFLIDGYWTVCDSLSDVKKTEQELNRKAFKLSYQKELLQLAKSLKI